jgi:hypothetical protein
MTEKVVGEIRFIETDDGFRIEMKGDKERLKEMGWGPGLMGPMGKGMGRGRKRFWREMRRGHEHGSGHKHGPGHRHGSGHGCGPGHARTRGPRSWWGREEYESEHSGGYEMPPKNV